MIGNRTPQVHVVAQKHRQPHSKYTGNCVYNGSDSVVKFIINNRTETGDGTARCNDSNTDRQRKKLSCWCDVTSQQGELPAMSNFAFKFRQIGPQWDKSGTF